jgi:tRNA 2-selenouridine synthase
MSSKLETTKDFKSIILNNTPLIDVRAPIEFVKGAFPNAINLPIMDDEERRLVGTTYKASGHEEATNLGHELVSGQNKENKIMAWTEFFQDHPDTIIYCFRGGQRSRISQEWISKALGREVLRIEGGYKAFRQYLLDYYENKPYGFNSIRLGGRTGSGKTILLHKIKHMVDLEGIANHRGSSFGNQVNPQPSQINFENTLAYDLIQKEAQYKTLIFEDEGRHVGRCFLPKTFSTYLATTPLVVLEATMEARVENILEEYVMASQQAHMDYYGESGLDKWLEYILYSVDRTKKRLGGVLHKELRQTIEDAFIQQQTGQFELHRQWIQVFLEKYYDPMYDYQLDKNEPHIIFKGNTSEVYDYLQSLA